MRGFRNLISQWNVLNVLDSFCIEHIHPGFQAFYETRANMWNVEKKIKKLYLRTIVRYRRANLRNATWFVA